MSETVVIAVILIVAVVAGVLGFAATKPNQFRVQRTTRIKAAPEKIFPLVSDLHAHGLWSPWEKKDPGMKRTFGGADSGKGATYAWDGNQDVGAGSMEIAEVTPPSQVKIKLDFIKPFEGHNTAEFTMLPQGSATGVSTNVIWAMHGPAPLLHRVMQVFMNMDRMIGKDFEAGLANLKKIA